MQRVRNWDNALLAWQNSILGSDFVWGETDCVSLMLKALEVMYGEPVIEHEGVLDYSNKQQALRALSSFPEPPQVLLSAGASEVSMSYAQNGDIIYGHATEEDDGPFPGLAVVVDHGAVISDPEKQVQRRLLRHVNPDAPLFRFPYTIER